MKRYFSLILLGSIGLGLFLPLELGSGLKYIIWAELFVIIFLSYFQVEISLSELKSRRWGVLLFYGLRFMILPPCLWIGVSFLSPFYGKGLFLLALLPVGVTAPALSVLFNGRMDLSLVLLILSSMLTPLLLPFYCQLFLGSELEINAWSMLVTLAITVVLPFFLYLPLRQRSWITAWARKINTPVIISLMAILVVLVSSENRKEIFSDPETLLWHLSVAGLAYALFYSTGWWFWGHSKRENRISLSLSSGANNIALGLAVGYTYFSPETGFFFVGAQLMWTLVLLPMERIFRLPTEK